MEEDEGATAAETSRFVGDIENYRALLAETELGCRDVEALDEQTFTIEVHADFSALPQAQFAAAHRASEAAYIPSRDVIAINRGVFDQRSHAFQKTVLLHEMAHALRHRNGIAAIAGDCPHADVEVVRWGVGGEDYIATRELYYGPKYGALLRTATSRDPKELEVAIEIWTAQVRAGIVVLPKRT